MVLDLEERANLQLDKADLDPQLKIEFASSQLLCRKHPEIVYGDDDKFQLQYNKVYKARLAALRPRLEEAVEEKFPDPNIKKLHQLRIGAEAVVFGIFIKTVANQPQILDEYLEDYEYKEENANKLSQEDFLGFEDDSQRIVISGITDARLREIMTGEVVAVCGSVTEKGTFEVVDWVTPVAAKPSTGRVKPTVVALAGDLCIGGDNSPSSLSLELLSNFVSGLAGETNEQKAKSKISRMQIAGLISNGDKFQRDKKSGKFKAAENAAKMKLADAFISSIASQMSIDVLTGRGDTGSRHVPTSGMHKLLFPKSRNGDLSCYSTPVQYSVNGTEVIHVSEFVVEKMKEYGQFETNLEVLKKLVQCSHMCPIAPDVIPMAPFQSSDPFVISIAPDLVWCIGDNFSKEIYEFGGYKMLLLEVPRFSTKQSMALLSTKKSASDVCDAQEVTFSLKF